MNSLQLSIKYLLHRPLNSLLNILLLSFGIGIISLLILFSDQFERGLSTNSKNIDLVIGAKGSPMQLVLCNVFHADFPTGNISLLEAEEVIKSRFVASATPLALGDSHRGFRLVGTTHDFLGIYGAELSTGELWNADLEVTAGSAAARELGLALGDEFESQHGLGEDGDSHGDHHFKVVGILAPTNSVIDDLLLISVPSVWAVHGQILPEVDSFDFSFQSSLLQGQVITDSTAEITSLLIKFRSPMGAIQMPRQINSQTNLQAASPSFETARLFSLVGVGMDVLQWLAIVLVAISAISIFVALYNALKDRTYDLAIMRTIGASKTKLFVGILLEGLIISAIGVLFGLAISHLGIEILNQISPEIARAGFTGKTILFEELLVAIGGLTLGILASILPARQVYQVDISKTLSSG